jgi:hypothetical protein
MFRSFRTCKIGGCSERGETCLYCKHYTPSASSKYKNCLQYIESATLCHIPKSPCSTCPFHIKAQRKTGRPNLSGIRWNNKKDLAEYQREYHLLESQSSRFFVIHKNTKRVYNRKGYATKQQALERATKLGEEFIVR